MPLHFTCQEAETPVLVDMATAYHSHKVCNVATVLTLLHERKDNTKRLHMLQQ